MVLTEGWDMPEVGCCILARPTRKMGLYRQMIGRVLRPAEGKPDAIVLDHSGAVFRHGFVEDHVEWTLDPDRRAASSDASATRRTEGGSRLLECSQCGAIRVAGEPCSHCGFLPQRPPRAVPLHRRRSRPGRWRAAAPKPTAYDPAVRARWHAMLTWIAERARLQAGMGRVQIQGKIRHLAAVGRAAGADHSRRRRSAVWVRSRQIACARRRA